MKDQPRVQFARTSDGVRIAYCVAGEGTPLVIVAPPINHVQLEWQVYPQLYGALARSFRVIWFDFRGNGLSQRDNLDFSVSGRIQDLSAVLDRVGADTVILLGFNMGTPVAISYAAQAPERVSSLVLVDPIVSAKDFADLPAWRAERAMRGQDWVIYTETLTRVLFGLKDEALAKQWAEYFRTAIHPDAWQEALSAYETYDVSSLVPGLKVPTLVIYDDSPWVSADSAQQIAADIPNGEFLAIHDETFATVPGIVEEFVLKRKRSESEVAGQSVALRTVLFTDLVGHTSMMSRLGDERGRAVLREHERITREVLKAHGGTEIKTMGDGFMASFGSVTRAVECAVALQRAIDERNRGVGVEQPRDDGPNKEGHLAVAQPLRAPVEPISVRVGLNAGEPIEEEGDLFGATVILASRIAAKAEGGEILVADTVRGLCSGKGFLFADRGEFVAKGFEEPVRVYEVRWRE